MARATSAECCSGSAWWWSPSGVVEVLWLGLVTTTLAYLLFGVGLQVLQPGHIATLNLFEPAVATILGVTILGEHLGIAGWIGVVVILAALALLGIADNVRGGSDAATADDKEAVA